MSQNKFEICLLPEWVPVNIRDKKLYLNYVELKMGFTKGKINNGESAQQAAKRNTLVRDEIFRL